MRVLTPASRRRWWLGLHPLVRLGWLSVMGKGPADVRIGAALLAAGLALQRRKQHKKVLLYRHTMRPGESMRIRVSRGGRVVAERTIDG